MDFISKKHICENLEDEVKQATRFNSLSFYFLMVN